MDTTDQIVSSFKLFSKPIVDQMPTDQRPTVHGEITKQRIEDIVSIIITPKYLIPVFFCILFVVIYYSRHNIYIIYSTHISESVRQLIGEMFLKLHLSPAGEFMTTYIPNTINLDNLKPF